MHTRSLGLHLLCAGLMAGFCAGQGSSKSKPSTRSGQKIFASMCASCHGLDGRGSERAPNIAQSAGVQALSDQKLRTIVSQGLPGTGMPAFRSLTHQDLASVVARLRTLQGQEALAPLPGDEQRGKNLFFGVAGCSSCHMFKGQGGFIARDLSNYATTHRTSEIKEAFAHETRDSESAARHVLVILKSGDTFDGLVRNEDNFSMQLQSLDGTFHFLTKSDINRISAQPPLMPTDAAKRISDAEINDLVKFLASEGKHGKSEPEESE